MFIEFLNGIVGTPFSSSTNGTGAVVASYAGTETTGKTGVLRMSTGTTTTGRAGIGTNLGCMNPNGMITTVHTCIYIPALSTAAQEYSIIAGFFDAISQINQTNGAYFTYDRANSIYWRMNTAKASSITTTDTGVEVATGWTLLRVELDGVNTEARFYINDTIAGTVTTNIPTEATETFGFGEGIIKSAGTTNTHMLSDFVSFSFEQPVPVLPPPTGGE